MKKLIYPRKKEFKVEAYKQNITELFKELNTSEKGISTKEAKTRLHKFGKNKIIQKKKTTWLEILLRQFNSILIYILIAALIISLILGEVVDAYVILTIVILNTLLGFTQEYRANNALEKLKKLSPAFTTVYRDNIRKRINTENIVIGDILVLSQGDKIPVDARIINSQNLQVDEAILTGESRPVEKTNFIIKKSVLISEQENMLFGGTIITKGKVEALVVKTAMKTEFGKIAETVLETKQKLTPLQNKLKIFGKKIGVITLFVCLLVFILGILRAYFSTGLTNEIILNYFLIAVALSVAGIPEGLPAVITASLALGVHKLVKHKALIRKMPAVETLGSTNIICTDKTGTLTKNEMTVKKIFVDNNEIEVTGAGYFEEGNLLLNKQNYESNTLNMLLLNGVLNNDSFFQKGKVVGDPTEAALLISGSKYKLDKKILDKKHPRLKEYEFDSERKLMTTINKFHNETIVLTKGATENLLKKCNRIMINGKIQSLKLIQKNKILKKEEEFSKQALRVLAFAFKSKTSKNNESELVFLGLQAMIDPPRNEIKKALSEAKAAGIRTMMITGDNKQTAIAIAKEIGLSFEQVLTGNDIEVISDLELLHKVKKVNIFARVTPNHKLRIINELRKAGNIVAVTGDGINDAPALAKADIGIAMGITGTDVSKESADMILLDDNYSTIVKAISHGRGIYNNIKNFVKYVLPSNAGEILVILIAILIGWPLPLIAIQILMINLITDGFPSLALSLDEYPRHLMSEKPRSKREEIIDKKMIRHILLVGIIISIGTLFMYWTYGFNDEGRTIAFTTLVFFQLFNVAGLKSENFKFSIRRNKFLFSSLLISAMIQLIVVYSPLNTYFGTVPIQMIDWIYITLITSTLYFIVGYYNQKNFKYGTIV